MSRDPDSGWAVEADGLVKTFGRTRAVDGVDLQVATGSVYGVLGPNGAGKTTTIAMLATLMQPDAGDARVFGHDVARDPRLPAQRARPHRAVRLARRRSPGRREPACCSSRLRGLRGRGAGTRGR